MESPPADGAAAGRPSSFATALTGPLDGAAVVPADYEAENRSHGGKTDADDADAVLDDGPDDGIDIGPCDG